MSLKPSLLAFFIAFVIVDADVGPETCGVDRALLAQWFKSHGAPSLVVSPKPDLLRVIDRNPYDDPVNPPIKPEDDNGVCAMQWGHGEDKESKRSYRLQSFASEKEALAANFSVTHAGHCGACSSLQDLGVYLASNLTAPVRHCSLLGLISSAWEVECLAKLDFSAECASIWHYNIVNTRQKCFGKCLLSYMTNEAFNKKDGSLNDCLACDERYSYPNFNFFAGRTRRNSGIRSSIKRRPAEIFNVNHCYFYGTVQ